MEDTARKGVGSIHMVVGMAVDIRGMLGMAADTWEKERSHHEEMRAGVVWGSMGKVLQVDIARHIPEATDNMGRHKEGKDSVWVQKKSMEVVGWTRLLQVQSHVSEATCFQLPQRLFSSAISFYPLLK